MTLEYSEDPVLSLAEAPACQYCRQGAVAQFPPNHAIRDCLNPPAPMRLMTL
jgi:hypothetical protein